VLSQYLPGGSEHNDEKPQDSQFRNRDLNPTLPECMFRLPSELCGFVEASSSTLLSVRETHWITSRRVSCLAISDAHNSNVLDWQPAV
jgi:hypothetical protein